LRETVRRIAPKCSNVLILGESGTGKEVLARMIHSESARADGPFVAVNCGALPETLAEAELFGYERGAFTGAVKAKPGLFEQAHNGTLFLDEITECAPAMQVKLLRALQEREIQRLGGTRRIAVDVRVIAASNRDLEEAVRAGTLRKDLYYRLRVVELSLCPLRERKEDIPLLCEDFLRKHATRNGSSLRSVSLVALWAMEDYDWPGNVRELENAIERATVLAGEEDGEELLPSHLPPEIRNTRGTAEPDFVPGSKFDLEAALQRVRRRYITAALRIANGNKTEAARLLGISRRGLYNFLSESNIPLVFATSLCGAV
jgi:two-component system response regulator HydG